MEDENKTEEYVIDSGNTSVDENKDIENDNNAEKNVIDGKTQSQDLIFEKPTDKTVSESEKKSKTEKTKAKSKAKNKSKTKNTLNTENETKDISENENKEKKHRLTLSESFDSFQRNVPAIIITFLSAIIIMGMACIAIFFANSKGHEQVLVPNVVGKKWDEALLEMQVKELYPKINLRYSDVLGDEGTILEQDPEAGAIVKGYSRVSLVISRGVVIDEVGSYVGKNIDEVKMSLQTLFAGQTRPLIVLADPQYKPDVSEAGTILEQDPPEGSKISEPVTVNLIVSRGPNYENTRRPYVIGQSINDLLQTIARSKIVFDISSHEATGTEKAGTVVSQEQIESEFVPNYTRVSIDMAMPQKSNDTDNISGIFQTNIANYPYPVSMKLEAIPPEGNAYTILNFNHPGGNITIPYTVAKDTTLVLYVVEKEKSRILVE